MDAINFTKCGYNFFLVPDDNGYYQLKSDSTQHLGTSEKDEKILSILDGKSVIIRVNQEIEGHVVESIEKASNGFKVKLSGISRIFRLFLFKKILNYPEYLYGLF